MTLVKYNTDFETAPKSFSGLLDQFFNDTYANKVAKFLPKVDLAENETGYEIQAALPGLKKEDIGIEVNDGKLTISGERKFVKEENKKNFHSVETQYGSFSRSFVLPDNVDSDKIEASYNDGILVVQIAKDEKKVAKKSVAIK